MAMFGWCMDRFHLQCPGSTRNLTCSCTCHKPKFGRKKTQ